MPIFAKGVSRGLCDSISYCLGLSFFRLVHRTMGWICAYRRIWSRSYIATFPLTNEPMSGDLCSAAEWSGAKQSGMERSAAGERVSDYFPPNSSIWALWTHSASVCRSISHFLFLGFRRFVSGFCITVPLQPQATAAVLYTAPPTAHTLYFDAPAQHPRLCQLVCLALFQYSF